MDTTPLAKDLWEGIAGHFDSISQVICEFVDNSISNFEGNKVPTKTVYINIEEEGKGLVKVQIEDTGTGIENFQPVMRLGDKSARQTPLNEHGFGLKHALASANPTNDNWIVYSRIEDDFKNSKYTVLSAPYSFNMEPRSVSSKKRAWPGIFNGTGVVVEFKCTELFFHTIQKGIKGRAGFETCLDYLREELGYIYAGVIEKGKVNITVASKQIGYGQSVEAVKPSWVDYYKPGTGNIKVDLGGGDLTLEYQFGEMKESSYVKHYKRNMSTSGVEVRINGRLLVSNVFKEIWEIENHPTYNHFLVIIDLITQIRSALPRTRTSKNGIRSGDEKLETLFEWIRKTHPTPQKDLSGVVSEKELVKELAELKEKHIRNPTKHIKREFEVFRTVNSPVPVDLYVYDGSDVVLYEAKKGTADVQNLYQLLMYWDGAVVDGLKPTEGILIASTFSPGVEPILEVLNSATDSNGDNYNFSTKTWVDEGIKYPKL